MALDQDFPGQFEMSIGDESIPFTMQAEISHMTLEEAIASGFFDLPDEPGMIRIPVTINVEIPLHLLYPPQPPEDRHAPDELYDVAEDEADREARRRRAAGCEFISEGIREMYGPAAAAEKAAFRDMLQVIRSGKGQGLPALRGNDAEERAAFCDLLKVIHGSRGQSFPMPPATKPIDVTDAEFRDVVESVPSGDAHGKPPAKAVVAQHDPMTPSSGGSGGGAGGRAQALPTLPVAEPIDTTDVELPRIVVDGPPFSNSAVAATATPAPAALPATTAPVSLPAVPAGQAAAGSGATGPAAAAPSPIDPATLPQDPLDPAQYATVVARHRYLASKYDPSSTADRAENLITGAMSDPARVLTPSEQAEHKALSAAIFRTLVPTPTPDEARLDAIASSPLGTIASLGVRATGGSQPSQDLALHLGAAAEGIGLSAAGARAGPTTAFLGAQTGSSVPIEPQPINAASAQKNAYLETLRARRSDDISEVQTFKANGVSPTDAALFLTTTNGQQFLNALQAADPGASSDTIASRAVGQIQSGRKIPQRTVALSPLVKIVPEGQPVSPYSPYFTTLDELKKANSSGLNFGDYFGLPIDSQARTYDVYQIDPLDSSKVFISTVAPTTELGGLVEQPGGSIQAIVPDRGRYSNPVLLGKISN